MAPKQIPSVIKCQTSPALQRELVSIQEGLAPIETEETWDSIAAAISRLMALTKGSYTYYPREIIDTVRTLSRPLNSAINSERSKLSAVAIDLMTTLSSELRQSFEPLLPLFFPTLLAMCTRSNKVFVTRAKASLLAIVEHTTSTSMLTYFSESITDKSVSLRLATAECTLACLNSFNPPDLEKEPRAREIEAIIRKAAIDANADVRKVGRKLFEAYKILLPGRVASFVDPMTPTIKKYLDIRSSNLASMPGKTAKFPLSSSTSSLEPATKAFRLGTHGRSASEATMARATRSKGEGMITKPDQPTRTATPTISEQSSASATLSTTDMPPPRHVPSRPMRPVGTSQPPLRNASRQPDLAMRPSSSADVYQPQTGGDRKERVVGGARRVPRPPAETKTNPAADVEKTANHEIALSTPELYSLVSSTSKKADLAKSVNEIQRQHSTKATEKSFPVLSAMVRQPRDTLRSTIVREGTNETLPNVTNRTINNSKTVSKANTVLSSRTVSKTDANANVRKSCTNVSSQVSHKVRVESTKPIAPTRRNTRCEPDTMQKHGSAPQADIRRERSSPPSNAALVPLPPSPVLEATEDAIKTEHLRPDAVVVACQEDKVQTELHDTASANPEAGTSGVKDHNREPTTPKRLGISRRLDLVAQTPISALVADIERDFVLDRPTPLRSLTHLPLWDLSNDFIRGMQTAPLNIAGKFLESKEHEGGVHTS